MAAKKPAKGKKQSSALELDQLRSAVHQLLNHDTSAPKEVEDRVRELMYGR